ncbi:MAG: glycerate kinase [Deltaproteobacteria bacterium]|nr:glycerate kinase [Deltaproteobacteria bacterium]
MKILVAPNAFNGTLSSPQAAAAMVRGLARSGLDCQLVEMPIADGGDDTLEVLTRDGGSVRSSQVQDPLGRPVEAAWGMMADGRTGVVEMARASGLALLGPGRTDPMTASTYGTGQLIAEAIRAGARQIIIGLGGSATVDGGAGCLQALGLRLLDERGQEVSGGGGSLNRVRRIETGGLLKGLAQVRLLVACDVVNPLLGPQGAAAVFGPQKGASPEEVAQLEANLAHFFGLIQETLGVEVARLPGSGAAGGLAAGLAAVAGAELTGGAQLILDHLGLESRLKEVDLVVTGEGRIDSQTLGGKGPFVLAEAARARGLPVVALAGSLGPDEEALLGAGFSAIGSIVTGPMGLEEASAQAAQLLERASARLGRWLALGLSLA